MSEVEELLFYPFKIRGFFFFGRVLMITRCSALQYMAYNIHIQYNLLLCWHMRCCLGHFSKFSSKCFYNKIKKHKMTCLHNE